MTNLINIKNDFESYQKLISFYQEHKNKKFEKIDLGFKTWFAANMCAALGGILDLFSDNLNETIIVKIDKAIEKILLKNNFLSYFGHQSIPDRYHTTIQFLKLKPTDGKFFKKYVIEELVGRAELPEMSELLKEKMTEAIYEIFVNAQIHSKSKHIYTCGQFYPTDNKIEFTIVDVGIGFKEKINKRFNSSLNSTQAIEWAITNRNTTKVNMSGGIGLALLKEFVKKNKGKMQIISDDGFYEFGNDGLKKKFFIGSFPGTIVNLQFKTNDSGSYVLKEELTANDIF